MNHTNKGYVLLVNWFVGLNSVTSEGQILSWYVSGTVCTLQIPNWKRRHWLCNFSELSNFLIDYFNVTSSWIKNHDLSKPVIDAPCKDPRQNKNDLKMSSNFVLGFLSRYTGNSIFVSRFTDIWYLIDETEPRNCVVENENLNNSRYTWSRFRCWFSVTSFNKVSTLWVYRPVPVRVKNTIITLMFTH